MHDIVMRVTFIAIAAHQAKCALHATNSELKHVLIILLLPIKSNENQPQFPRIGICKLDSGGGAVPEHCPHRTAPLRA